MNEPSDQNKEGTMQGIAEFERLLRASAPQPRLGFEAELGQRLRQEFIQRSRAKVILTKAQPQRLSRLPVRAIALIAILLIGIGTVLALNTLLQPFLNRDAGLKAILEQGLGHEIGISQSHEGFTVTLEWAYADGNRLTLAYTIQGHPGEQYTNLISDAYALTERNTGEAIPFKEGMAALLDEQGEALGFDTEGIPVSDRSLIIRTYDLSPIDTADRDHLDLHLEVDAYGITVAKRTQMPIEQFNDMKEGPEALFAFDFSIDLTTERRIFNTPLTATDQGITVHLQEVNVTPSQTRVIICFSPPDPAREWTAAPHLTTDDGDVPGGGAVQPFMDGEDACQDYTYYAGMFDYTGDWQLEISELIGFGSDGGDDQQRIVGSWSFAFRVPPAQ